MFNINKLSHDQSLALDGLVEWYKKRGDSPFITLGGFAGTGKTTLISVFRKKLDKRDKKLRVAFVSFTGKASRVLRSKLVETKSLHLQDSVSTIHSLIYSPIVNEREEIIGWEKREEIKYDLIIIDEASMVDGSIWADLCSYRIPIIAVGDHGQLPPIREEFNLMEKPILKLEQIHRQAKNNPIIKLSILAREKGEIPKGDYERGVRKISRSDPQSQDLINDLLGNHNKETLILCGYNSTRVRLNRHIRTALGFELEEPQIGDRVICLRNNHAKEICNGMLGTVQSVIGGNKDWFSMEVEMDGEKNPYSGLVASTQFNASSPLNFTKKRSGTLKTDLFDFGYALTVHKAQGSQAKRVILFEERFKQMDERMWRRWLYTAVTRAEEELFIIG